MRLKKFLFAPLLLLMVGCATGPSSQTVLQQIIQYGDLVSNALVLAVPAALAPMAQSGQIKTSDYQAAIAAVNALRQASLALDQVSSLDQAAPLVQQIYDSVGTLVAVAATVPQISPQIRTYLGAAEAGLPVIELIINLILKNQPAPAVPTPPAAIAPTPAVIGQ